MKYSARTSNHLPWTQYIILLLSSAPISPAILYGVLHSMPSHGLPQTPFLSHSPAPHAPKPYFMYQAVVFRQSRNLNGCMVMVSMSRKNPRGLDLHVRAYIPTTQETFRQESRAILNHKSPFGFYHFMFSSNGLLEPFNDKEEGVAVTSPIRGSFRASPPSKLPYMSTSDGRAFRQGEH